jgi:hypothetical protein
MANTSIGGREFWFPPRRWSAQNHSRAADCTECTIYARAANDSWRRCPVIRSAPSLRDDFLLHVDNAPRLEAFKDVAKDVRRQRRTCIRGWVLWVSSAGIHPDQWIVGSKAGRGLIYHIDRGLAGFGQAWHGSAIGSRLERFISCWQFWVARASLTES